MLIDYQQKAFFIIIFIPFAYCCYQQRVLIFNLTSIPIFLQIKKQNFFLHTNHFFFTQGFTMIIPSYSKRVKSLINSLEFILNNPPKSLFEIIINWASNNTQIEGVINGFSDLAKTKNISLRYSLYNDPSVNRRFSDANIMKTSALLSIDDDIRINPESLDFGFRVWENHQKQLVGFPCRCISKRKNIFFPKKIKFSYYCDDIYSNRLILTGLAFLSRELISAYYSKNNKQNLNIVKKLNNCEDILMNFVAMNISNRSSILIQRRWVHIYSRNGISSKHNHRKIRDFCINAFYKSFHKLPLPITEESIFY